MPSFLTMLGGLIGGAALILVPAEAIPISGINFVLDLLGALAVIFFASLFIISGIRSLFRRS